MKWRSAVTVPTLVLMGLGFALGACEYVTVVILPDIAEDVDVSLNAAGKLEGILVEAQAIGTPVVTAATGRAV